MKEELSRSFIFSVYKDYLELGDSHEEIIKQIAKFYDICPIEADEIIKGELCKRNEGDQLVELKRKFSLRSA